MLKSERDRKNVINAIVISDSLADSLYMNESERREFLIKILNEYEIPIKIDYLSKNNIETAKNNLSLQDIYRYFDALGTENKGLRQSIKHSVKELSPYIEFSVEKPIDNKRYKHEILAQITKMIHLNSDKMDGGITTPPL